jgi:CheY-like chemotaxis protein
MSSVVRHGILVVDDEATVRDSIGLALRAAGYEVSLAKNGFDALLQLQTALPTVIISALNRRQMSGFEFLSVVRRRFPHISVIAMSAAYHLGDAALGGVIADVFYPRRRARPGDS